MDVTASMVRCYKSCPKKYFFEYVECLKPTGQYEPLSTGSSYHACLEKLLKGEQVEVTDLPSAMAEAFNRFIPWRNWNITDVEKEYRVKLAPGVWLKGKFDALCADGTPVEHKSSSTKPDEKYRTKLFLDDQVSCYLLALSIMNHKMMNKIIYTVCAKPKLTAAKSPEELLQRQRGWFDAEKVQSFMVVRDEREITEFQDELVYLARSMGRRKVFYRNPSDCAIGGCRYQDICQNYDPHCLVGFEKKERRNEELCTF